ncbi:MAG TPA: FecR family protein, partial [Gammaproteobacteria bacterium]|nr:FecR family protein [Gammaproteobacteria bacterium]
MTPTDRTLILPGRAGLILLALLAAAPAQAAEVVGRVISRVGQVEAVGPEGQRRDLERRSEIREGETVVTGDSGRAQVRFKDQGLVDLKPGSRFTVKRYRAKSAGDDSDSAVMKLFKGGMRTITGAVGGGDKQEYRVETPVASIGVRGTQYLLRLCRGDCAGDVPDGLYGGVTQGRIGVSNGAGTVAFGGDRYFRVASYDDLPEGMLTPPDGLLTGPRPPQGGQGGAGGVGVAAGGEVPDLGTYLSALAAAKPSLEVVGSEDDFEGGERVDSVGGTRTLSGGSPTGSFAAPFTTIDFSNGIVPTLGVALEPNGDSVQLSPEGYVTGITATTSAGDPLVLSTSGTGTPVDTGSNPDLAVRWGRWNAADFTVSLNGTPITTSQPFFYAYSDNLTPEAALGQLEGRAQYSFRQGTAAHNGLATVALNRLTFDVDFSASQITDARIVIDNLSSGDTWVASQASPSESLSQKFVIPVAGHAGAGGLAINGEIDGAFVGINAEGAAVVYNVGNTDSGFVQGSG